MMMNSGFLNYFLVLAHQVHLHQVQAVLHQVHLHQVQAVAQALLLHQVVNIYHMHRLVYQNHQVTSMMMKKIMK
jgi:hypothetical protein